MKETTAPVEKRKAVPRYSALERSRAVLMIWTERRKPAEVCRELSIPWVVLDQWQQRALEGMLQALEPQVRLTEGIALSPRLQSLLEKQQQRLSETKVRQRLSRRLTTLVPEAPVNS